MEPIARVPRPIAGVQARLIPHRLARLGIPLGLVRRRGLVVVVILGALRLQLAPRLVEHRVPVHVNLVVAAQAESFFRRRNV